MRSHVLPQTIHYVIIEEVIENAISSQYNNVSIVDWMDESVSMSRRLVVSAALVRIVEPILLLLGAEEDFIILIWPDYQEARVAQI